MASLNEKELHILALFGKQTDASSLLTLEKAARNVGIDIKEMINIAKFLHDHNLIYGHFNSAGGIFRISSDGISVLREREAENNKSTREKLLDRCRKQSPLRPFVSVIVSVLALIISLFALGK